MKQEESVIFRQNNFVLYKSQAARITNISDKITIILADGRILKVRSKDISLLHPGPLTDFSQLDPLKGEVREVCEILSGETTSLAELAELIYSEFTVASAWSTYKILQERLYCHGTPDEIYIRTRDDLLQEKQKREQKTHEKKLYHEFIQRLKQGMVHESDHNRLSPVKALALGKTSHCKILKELNLQETSENAHRLLLKLSIWDEKVNPYIRRFGLTLPVTYPKVGAYPQEERLDLTHIHSFAIDDEGNRDPDDAIGIDGNKLWIHIADVAPLITRESPLDLHAQAMASSLYLPEQVIPMFPPEITALCGLGLQEISPALSFGITLEDTGKPQDVEIRPSWVKVTRLTYEQAEKELNTSPLKEIFTLTKKYQDYRRSQGALFLRFPEVKIRVTNDRVTINRLLDLNSRELVTESMVMVGELAARFALQQNIPFPFITQTSPESPEQPNNLAAMFAYRKLLQPSRTQCTPDLHAGLGLKIYCRATSPIRRYPDLLAHQQLRSFLAKTTLLDEQQILTRIGAYEAVIGNLNKLERLSNLHWTIVFLQQNPLWQGQGIVVEKRDRFALVLIPELGMETRLSTTKDIALNDQVNLAIGDLDLSGLNAYFQIH